MLLSPALPRLPGGLAAPTAPPPLEAAEFAPRPPPIPCDPLPEAVQQRLEAGEGWALALEGHRKHSQLAWALQERQVEEQRRREAAAAALAELEALQVCSLLSVYHTCLCRRLLALSPLLAWCNWPAACPPASLAHRLSGLHGPPGLPL